MRRFQCSDPCLGDAQNSPPPVGLDWVATVVTTISSDSLSPSLSVFLSAWLLSGRVPGREKRWGCCLLAFVCRAPDSAWLVPKHST